MATLELIHAGKENIPDIQAISNIVWPVTFCEILSPKQIRYMMSMMYSTEAITQQIEELSHHYLLVKEGDDFLGYLSYEFDYKGKGWTKIHKIYVLPDTQGKGVGRFFIGEVTKIAQAHGDTELSLNVNRFNKAIDFYKKVGFEVIGSEDIDIGNGFLMEDYIMNKKISSL
ncbi:MAG: GNAT family N-acetyltransferase [Tannerellaceae bacterium]|nr:GNAT family N-acetyltransferase [Tannerellaceae bacterium]